MEEEGENLTTGAGEPPSAADAYRVSRAALGGILGWSDCRSGTKGQPPLAFRHAMTGLRGGPQRPFNYVPPKGALVYPRRSFWRWSSLSFSAVSTSGAVALKTMPFGRYASSADPFISCASTR